MALEINWRTSAPPRSLIPRHLLNVHDIDCICLSWTQDELDKIRTDLQKDVVMLVENYKGLEGRRPRQIATIHPPRTPSTTTVAPNPNNMQSGVHRPTSIPNTTSDPQSQAGWRESMPSRTPEPMDSNCRPARPMEPSLGAQRTCSPAAHNSSFTTGRSAGPPPMSFQTRAAASGPTRVDSGLSNSHARGSPMPPSRPSPAYQAPPPPQNQCVPRSASIPRSHMSGPQWQQQPPPPYNIRPEPPHYTRPEPPPLYTRPEMPARIRPDIPPPQMRPDAPPPMRPNVPPQMRQPDVPPHIRPESSPSNRTDVLPKAPKKLASALVERLQLNQGKAQSYAEVEKERRIKDIEFVKAQEKEKIISSKVINERMKMPRAAEPTKASRNTTNRRKR